MSTRTFRPSSGSTCRSGRSSAGRQDGRKSEIKAVTRLDGRLILHGGENARGWAATVAEDTGRMTAGIVTDAFAFTLFGACTAP